MKRKRVGRSSRASLCEIASKENCQRWSQWVAIPGTGQGKVMERAKRHPTKPTRKRPAGSMADNVAERPALKRPAACVADVPPSGSKKDDPQTLGKAAVTSAQRSSWASVVGHLSLKDPPPTS
jgi:hypothetical protein